MLDFSPASKVMLQCLCKTPLKSSPGWAMSVCLRTSKTGQYCRMWSGAWGPVPHGQWCVWGMASLWGWEKNWLCPGLYHMLVCPGLRDTLSGLVVKVSTPSAVDLRLDTRFLCGDLSGLSHTSDLQIVTPVATLPGAWRYRVRAGTGWPSVSILWLSEMESLICNLPQCSSRYNCLSRSVPEVH